MKAAHLVLFFIASLFLSAPAHAHGSGLLVLVAFAGAPILILIFLPLCAMSGMAGRRWIALGLYLAALVVAFTLQWQDWYQPFARMFPEPVWLQQQLPEFVLIPPLDLLMWLMLAVIAIYLGVISTSASFVVAGVALVFLALVTFVPVITVMPCFLNERSSSAETASSSMGTSRGSSSMIVTALPKRRKIDANSTPTAPLPMMTIDFGISFRPIASSLVMMRV